MTKFKPVRIVLIALLISFVCLSGSAVAGEETTTSYLSLENLRSSGNDWEVTRLNITPGVGHIRMRHSQWLMYFFTGVRWTAPTASVHTSTALGMTFVEVGMP